MEKTVFDFHCFFRAYDLSKGGVGLLFVVCCWLLVVSWPPTTNYKQYDITQ